MGFCLQGTLCVAPDSCWNRQMRNVLKYSDTKKPHAFLHEVSVCDKIRTRDLLVRSQTLYPAELHIHLIAGIYITAATVIIIGECIPFVNIKILSF